MTNFKIHTYKTIKKFFVILVLFIMILGCAKSENKVIDYIDISDVVSVTVDNDNPPFNHYDMDQEDIEKLVVYLNSLDSSSLLPTNIEGIIGEDKHIILTTTNSVITIYCLRPYLCINSVWYKGSNDEIIFDIIKRYE